MSKGFPAAQHFSKGCGGVSSRPEAAAKSALKVFHVGGFVESFVPGFDDFSRLDPQFVIPKSVWDQISGYQDFGFVVFQLAEGNVRPLPMAFEFQSHGNQIYFPTVHIHDGQIHDHEEFDHVLYAQHAGFDSRVDVYRDWNSVDPATLLIRSKKQARSFVTTDATHGIVEPGLLIYRRFIKGNRKNEDIYLPVSGDPIYPAWNFRSSWAYVPGFALTVAFCWLIVRRNRLARIR